MRKIRFYLLTIALFLSTATAMHAQQRVFQLNSLEAESKAKTLNTDNDRQVFTLNEAVFTHPEFKAGATFTFDTGEGEPVRFILTRRTEYLPGTVSIIARRDGESDRVLAATYANGRLNGTYHQTHNASVSIGFDAELNQQYLTRGKSLQEKELTCGLHGREHAFISWPDRTTQQNMKAKSSGSSSQYQPAPLNTAEDDSITIDIMLVYTDSAEAWASTSNQGDINGVLAAAMNRSQVALDNSGIGVELRLVHVHNTLYDETTDEVESGDRLERITNGSDGYMDVVHDLRNEYGADLVGLIAKIDDTGGLAWRLGSSSGNPAAGYSVNRVQQIAGGYTLVHEFGHNFGNSHARTQNDARAGLYGGLFHYSTGYQNTNGGFHTVMAYADELEQAPLFSSPDLRWQGFVMGTNNTVTPENNTRSMKQVKHTIASYRPSVVDAPEASISDTEISVNMNREDEFTASFNLSNAGASNLMWNIDFDFPGNIIAKQRAKKARLAKTMKPVTLENQVRYPANYAPPMQRAKASQQETVIYSTSFGLFEGFGPGSYTALSSWRALSNSEFHIVNSGLSSYYLQMEYDGQTDEDGEPAIQFMSAPFFGYLPFGNYEVNINFEVGGPNYSDETFDFYLFDGKTGDYSSAVILANSEAGFTIYSADLDEQGELTFYTNGTANVTEGQYHTLRILYNATEGQIDYYFNGTQIYSSSYIFGTTPGEMQVLHRNSSEGSYMNIDDVEIRQLNTPTEWLSVSDMTGTTFANESSTVNLNFNTRGVSAGTYETLMTVATNDPVNPLMEVPVTLNVSNEVSNELENHPQKIALNQNYPNPFNPSTVISYQLTANSDVRLEVFDMAGRKVATLINERQNAGEHRINFDGANLASGIYMYRLTTPNQTLTRQMALIK